MQSALSAEDKEDSYCICGEGYVGQMVACDSADCPVQWFHFKCVGLAKKASQHWKNVVINSTICFLCSNIKCFQ